MAKRIVFPATSRVHKARQKLLLKELRKHFVVDVFEPQTPHRQDLEAYAIFAAVEFRNFLAGKNYDAALIRADRYELLPIAGIAAYRGLKVFHIEGGADSGPVIDTRVRNAITSLADVHLVTDDKARRAVQAQGAEHVYNVGSLDVAFAHQVIKARPKPVVKGDYILLLHHAIPGENSKVVYDAVKDLGLEVVGVKSNTDYGASLMTEEYSAEDFISLVYHAKCFVGNSSAITKEASILGTPCVLTGSRQDGRIAGWNALRCPHDMKQIKQAVKWQISHDKYRPDFVYYQPNTEKDIAKIVKRHL